uniref:Glutaredoxin domain-containing protein n=1 Tax=Ascaris lumbricoides TaxID=6252 RepID=A0A9J2PIQ6_ASCLU
MTEDVKGTVIVYSIVGCPRCDAAKNHLSRLRIPYTDISLDSFPQCRDEMERLCGNSDVPQIFFNEVHIGDEEGLKALVRDVARFDAMMEMLRTEEASRAAPSLPQPQTSLDYVDEDETSSTSSMDGVFLCIPNEYSRLVAGMKKANIIKDNRVGSTLYGNSFKGEHFIDWIMQQRHLKLKDALEIGQELIERQPGRQMSRGSGEIFSPERYYQLRNEEESVALNTGLTIEQSLLSARELNHMLIAVLEPLYDHILTEDRKACSQRFVFSHMKQRVHEESVETIKYVGIEDNEYFQDYVALSRDIQRLNVQDASRWEKIAVFVNIYNVMLIHAFTKYGSPNDVWQRRKLLNSTYYVIGGQLYSLQSILNGILRGNKRGVNMLWEPFGSQDRRLHLALSEAEPLVHFAVNYGTKSGPPIRLYSVENVTEEMKSAAREFLSCEDNLHIDVKKSTIFLPYIFDWYAEDFGRSKRKVIPSRSS